MMIPLTQGQFAVVDDDDFPRLATYNWQATRQERTYYARRAQTQPDGKQKYVAMHRQIMNAPDGMEVDHVDGDGLNNRKSNLRICTHAENNRNLKLKKNNKSGYRGVCWDKPSRGWRANLGGVYLGIFDTAELAAMAYDTAARATYGEFASLNFPDVETTVAARVGALRRSNSSGHANVSARPDGRWYARVIVDGKRVHVGYFGTIEEAVKAQEDKITELA